MIDRLLFFKKFHNLYSLPHVPMCKIVIMGLNCNFCVIRLPTVFRKAFLEKKKEHLIFPVNLRPGPVQQSFNVAENIYKNTNKKKSKYVSLTSYRQVIEAFCLFCIVKTIYV